MVTKRRANRDSQPFQTVWFWYINSQVNGAEKKDEKFLDTYGNVAYEKGDVSNQWGKMEYSVNGLGQLGSHVEGNKIVLSILKQGKFQKIDDDNSSCLLNVYSMPRTVVITLCLLI